MLELIGQATIGTHAIDLVVDGEENADSNTRRIICPPYSGFRSALFEMISNDAKWGDQMHYDEGN